ncbi:DUF1788 domain-containing protein [Deinococcus yavapaiensis]|uniref:Uncharacterized protein DUF1788 n=1 Tax=Deinococcus yavapaiensis KR-236 TaxID=694435 RepID=A0A318S8B1_9DEIO|nr:DUF1788 domain-containing protein [Deinococcus yavapaiensis]PYE52021.1 uncharacterized protein DUF1788 [Deinococcus yavapaiensis KR-236]
MRELTLPERLDRLKTALSDPAILKAQGLGNEIAFYIFDYDPQFEPTVTAHVQRLLERLEYEVLHVDLYRVCLEAIDARGLTQRALDLEAQKGSAALAKALHATLAPDKLARLIAEKVTPQHRLVFLTGVGAAWPLARSHALLNNLHALLDHVPLVTFYPGRYDGESLKLFSTFDDDNYYRAFQLVPRTTRSA